MIFDKEKVAARMAQLGMSPNDLTRAAQLAELTVKRIRSGQFVHGATAAQVAAALGIEAAEYAVHVMKKCVACGKEYEPTHPKQKYCSACAVKVRREQTNEWGRKFRRPKGAGNDSGFDLQMFARREQPPDQTIDDERLNEDDSQPKFKTPDVYEPAQYKLERLIVDVECDYESAYRTMLLKEPGEIRTAWALRTKRLEAVLKKLRGIEADLKQDKFMMEMVK